MISLASIGATMHCAVSRLATIDVQEIINQGQDSINDGGSLSNISTKIDDFGGGSYNIAMKIGVWVAIIAFVCGAIRLMFSDSGSHNDAKGRIIRIIAGVVLLGCATGLVIWITDLNLFG